MGIIVLAIAIIPLLGIGGMQLYRAEMSGPMKDQKIQPRIAETAKALWFVYFFLTMSCTLAYWLAGMTPLMHLHIVSRRYPLAAFLHTMPASVILIARRLILSQSFSCGFRLVTLHCTSEHFRL